MRPDWLPPELQLNGISLQDNIDELFEVFQRDFLEGAPIKVGGMLVQVNNVVNKDWGDSRYTHGFTHIITKGSENRAIDFDRARKLPWVRAILENYRDKRVFSFWSTRIKSGRRLFLWLEEYDFVVILSPLASKKYAKAGNCLIVTAYHVDSSWHRRYLEKLRNEGRLI